MRLTKAGTFLRPNMPEIPDNTWKLDLAIVSILHDTLPLYIHFQHRKQMHLLGSQTEVQ